MPVAREKEGAPDWCRFGYFGVFSRNSEAGAEVHFHDADEYWFIIEGRGIVTSEGKEYEVGRGDVLFTKMGDYHGVVKVLEAPFSAFYVVDELKGKKRKGHLLKKDEFN